MCEKKEIFIRFKQGDKEAEMALDNLHPENQLALMDGLFKFFDVDVAFKELVEVSLRTRKAYLDFYKETNTTAFTETNEQIEEPVVEEPEGKVAEIKEELKKQAEDSANWETSTDQKEESHWYTGIKVKNGVEHFKLHYRCPTCMKASNVYIKKNDRYVHCYDCNTKMMVKPATTEELGRDVYGNYFIAGNLDPQTAMNEI